MVVFGAVVIAAIGFAGSYAAVRDLAIRKGFGAFATVFPIGVDAGIAVLLALDLLLTWLRIPLPMLRQAAWLLTAATIGFNGAAAWPDPVGVGMHGVIPLLFVVTVEAARHAVGRLAAITDDRHMEGVRLWRWILAPLPTFRLWRRMMLWEIRKYDDVIRAEQQRLIYQARLRGRFGRGWRWRAPVEDLLPLKIARYGVSLDGAARQGAREPGQGGASALRLERSAAAADPETQPQDPAMEQRLLGSTSSAGRVREGELPSAPAEVGAQSITGQDFPADAAMAEAEQNLGQTGGSAVPRSDLREDDGLLTAGLASEAGGDHSELTDGRVLRPPEDGVAGGDAEEASAAPSAAEQSRTQQGREADTVDGGDPRPDADHASVIDGMKSNAAAVRYAMSVLGSTHTPTIVDWLAQHGRVVNRGQAHKITQNAKERARGQRLQVVKKVS
ncbi:DUF2637 domain-containing protein [Streptomyces sp. SID9913]|nr:DUF2637 domain-containing protein [Streptomyces sp. SID9913]